MEPCKTPCGDVDCLNTCNHYDKGIKNMKSKNLTVVFKDLNNLSITKTREKWVDEITEYQLELAYLDGEYANGLLDDLLRCGFKGYWDMTDEELTQEIIQELESRYDTGEE